MQVFTYSEITVKTHVKIVNLKYSGLLYHAKLFTIQSTMPKCRWYSKSTVFQVYSFSTALEAAIKCKKYSGITVNLCTLFSMWPIFATTVIYENKSIVLSQKQLLYYIFR